MSSPTQLLHRSNFFLEARGLIDANNPHFGALSILFVFPPWFFFILFPWFLQTMILSESNGGIIHKPLLSFYTAATYPIKYKSIAFSSLYTLFVFSLSIVSIATVTYSTHLRPLTLITTIKSLSSSFFPLASSISLILICITALFASIFYTGFEIDFSYPNYFIGIFTLIIIVGLFLLFCVYSMLASVLAVLESKWGFEALRHSYYIIKRMKLTGLSLLLLNGFGIWCVLVLGFSFTIFYGTRVWSFAFLLQVAYISLVGAMFTFQFVAASTVSMFAFCRDCRLAMDDKLKLALDSKVKDNYLARFMDLL